MPEDYRRTAIIMISVIIVAVLILFGLLYIINQPDLSQPITPQHYFVESTSVITVSKVTHLIDKETYTIDTINGDEFTLTDDQVFSDIKVNENYLISIKKDSYFYNIQGGEWSNHTHITGITPF